MPPQNTESACSEGFDNAHLQDYLEVTLSQLHGRAILRTSMFVLGLIAVPPLLVVAIAV